MHKEKPPFGGHSLDDISWALLKASTFMRTETTSYRRREIARWRRAAASAAFWQGMMATVAMPSYVARSCATVTHPFA
jgi:hypothetical protein